MQLSPGYFSHTQCRAVDEFKSADSAWILSLSNFPLIIALCHVFIGQPPTSEMHGSKRIRYIDQSFERIDTSYGFEARGC